MIRNFTQQPVRTELVKTGNWNHLDKDEGSVNTKPIGKFFIGEDHHVFKHSDILELLDLYYLADEESMRMIRDPRVDTGGVKTPEKAFLEKIRTWVEEKDKQKEELNNERLKNWF